MIADFILAVLVITVIRIIFFKVVAAITWLVSKREKPYKYYLDNQDRGAVVGVLLAIIMLFAILYTVFNGSV